VPVTADPGAVAAEVLRELTACGATLAVAESLTGGLVCARLVDVPGASAVLRGGVVAYATDLKHELLGVDAALLEREGPVHPQVAEQMAAGVRRRLGATHGVATTGVAGPGEQDGQAPGTVFVAVDAALSSARHRSTALVRGLILAGDRDAVRQGATDAVLHLLLESLRTGRTGSAAGDPVPV
jgi:nicotinamide-nucleotide amidase